MAEKVKKDETYLCGVKQREFLCKMSVEKVEKIESNRILVKTIETYLVEQIEWNYTSVGTTKSSAPRRNVYVTK